MIFTLAVATSMTTQRGKSNPSIFLPFQVAYLVFKSLLVNSTFIQGDYINIDDALDNVQFPHPLIVGFGMDLSSLADPRVIVEKSNVLSNAGKLPIWVRAIIHSIIKHK